MWSVESAAAALDIVELQGTIQPLPKVRVLDGHHLAEVFPSPLVSAPLGKAVPDARPHVVAALDERHSRGLIERLERPYDRQQIKPLNREVGLGVMGLELPLAVVASQDELPTAALTGAINVRKQQEVRC